MRASAAERDCDTDNEAASVDGAVCSAVARTFEAVAQLPVLTQASWISHAVPVSRAVSKRKGRSSCRVDPEARARASDLELPSHYSRTLAGKDHPDLGCELEAAPPFVPLLRRVPCFRAVYALRERLARSVSFWVYAPWVVGVVNIVVCNVLTLVYGLRYFACALPNTNPKPNLYPPLLCMCAPQP